MGPEFKKTTFRVKKVKNRIAILVDVSESWWLWRNVFKTKIKNHLGSQRGGGGRYKLLTMTSMLWKSENCALLLSHYLIPKQNSITAHYGADPTKLYPIKYTCSFAAVT